MRKTDLIRQVAKDTNLTIKDATAAYDSIFENIEALLLQGDSVSVERMFTFKVKELSPREAFNPSTGEKIHVGKRKTVRLSLSSVLKQKLKALTPVENETVDNITKKTKKKK